MSQKKISSGAVHEMPADLKKALTSDPQALTAWEDITPLARNEWICWIESAKKAETRSRRIEWGCSSLKDGKRRLCLSKISKCLSAWELVFLHNSRRCSFFSRHSWHLWPRSSGRVLPSGSRTWLYAIKSACSRGLQESAQN